MVDEGGAGGIKITARNAARNELQKPGFFVITAADGFEARARLAETPVKDAIVIAGDLIPVLRDEQTIELPEQTAWPDCRPPGRSRHR